MGASIGVRPALVRSLCRKSVEFTFSSAATSTFLYRVSVSASSVRSGLGLGHRAAASSLKSVRFLRRELSSLLPLHSAIASALSFGGRFVNYLSPI